MRKGAVIFIILSFTGLAVFGFLGMGAHEMEHGGINGCLAALQREIGCPAPASPFEFATFHLSAFKIFSSANMGTAVLLSTVLTTLMLFLASLLKIYEPKLIAIPATESAFITYPRSYEFHTPNELKFIRWLVLYKTQNPVLV
ncbi:MAG TPA: hypothetical protein VJ046_03075 [Candidatus Paceibacterota bacterium]|nr:hypothetical protein [Candidatus Paceibacterota bacterium]